MRKFHGLLTLFLASAAGVLGIYTVFENSVFMGAVYCACLVLAVPIVLYFYCAKCPGKESCGHVLPGLLTKLLPEREPGRYTPVDYVYSAAAILVIVLFPQYWLFKDVILFIIYWVIMTAAVIDIIMNICSGCPNSCCPLCRKKK